MSEPVGSIPVLITGDWSQLEAALQQAVADATAGASKIASAFNSAAGSLDPLAASANNLQSAFRNLEVGSSLAGASIQGLTQAVAQETAATQAATANITAMAAASQQAASDIQGAAAGIQALISQLGGLQQAAAAATAGLQQVAQQAQQTGGAAQQGAASVGDLMSAFAKVTGITIGIAALRGFGEAAIEAFAHVERAQIAFEYLTGSAQKAAEAMQGFRSISMNLALPFDSVVAFSQQLLAAGVSVNQLGTAITDAADAAAARGVSFDVAASAIERITETGNVSSKVLRQLGLTMDDLAEATGIDAKNIKEFFASLDDNGRLDVLTVALEKFKGASKAVADSTSGDIQRIKDAWTFALQDIGEALVKAESGGGGFSGIVTAIKSVETVILELILLFQDLGAIVGGVVATVVSALQAMSRAATASSWHQFFQELKDGFVQSAAVSQSTWDQMAADAQRAADKINNIWSTHKLDATPDQYGAFNRQAAADRTDAAAKAFVPKPKGHSPVDPMITEFNRLDEATNKLLHDADTDYQDYLGTLDQGGKKASVLVHELAAEISKAEVALPHMTGVWADGLQHIIGTLETALTTQKKFAAEDELIPFAAKAQKEFEGLADKTDALSDEFDKLAIKSFSSLQKLGDGVAITTSYATTLVGQVQIIPGLFDRVADHGKRAFADLLDALGKTGIAWDGDREKLNALLPAIDKVFTSQLSQLPQVEAEWAKYGKQIEHAAAAGVPAAIKAWDDYIAAIGRLQSPIAEAIKKEEELQKKIAEGALAGKQVGDLVFLYEKEKIAIGAAADAAKAMSDDQMFAIAAAKIAEQDLSNTRHQMSQAHLIELANMTLAVQAHRDAVNFLSDTYKKLQGDVVSGFENLGRGYADAIASSKSFGEASTKVWNAFKKQILEDIIGGAFKLLGEQIAIMIGKMLGIETAQSAATTAIIAGNTAIINSNAAVVASYHAITLAIQEVVAAAKEAQAANIAGAPGSPSAPDAGAGDTGGGTGLGGVIDTVSGVVSAVSSVVQAVELKQMLSKLKVIEENTRKSAILAQQTSDNLTSMHSETFQRLGDILNAVDDVILNLQNFFGAGLTNIFTRLGDMWSTERQFLDGLVAMAAALDGIVEAMQAQGSQLTTIAMAVEPLGKISDALEGAFGKSAVDTSHGSGGPTGGSSGVSGGSVTGGSTGATVGTIESHLDTVAEMVGQLALVAGQEVASITDLTVAQGIVFAAVAQFAAAQKTPLSANLFDRALENQNAAQEALAGMKDFLANVANVLGNISGARDAGKAAATPAAQTKDPTLQSIDQGQKTSNVTQGQELQAERGTQASAQGTQANTEAMAAAESATVLHLKQISQTEDAALAQHGAGTVATVAGLSEIHMKATELVGKTVLIVQNLLDTKLSMGIVAAASQATQAAADATTAATGAAVDQLTNLGVVSSQANTSAAATATNTAATVTKTAEQVALTKKLNDEASIIFGGVIDLNATTTTVADATKAVAATTADMSKQLAQLIQIGLYQSTDLDAIAGSTADIDKQMLAVLAAVKDYGAVGVRLLNEEIAISTQLAGIWDTLKQIDADLLRGLGLSGGLGGPVHTGPPIVTVPPVTMAPTGIGPQASTASAKTQSPIFQSMSQSLQDIESGQIAANGDLGNIATDIHALHADTTSLIAPMLAAAFGAKATASAVNSTNLSVNRVKAAVDNAAASLGMVPSIWINQTQELRSANQIQHDILAALDKLGHMGAPYIQEPVPPNPTRQGVTLVLPPGWDPSWPPPPQVANGAPPYENPYWTFAPPPPSAMSPAVPSMLSATGAGLPSGQLSTSSTVHIAAINIYDAQTPRQSADAIMRELSKRSPAFSQAATRTR